MADWKDVMHARREADSALSRLEDAGTGNAALATMLAARAVCLELRAHAMLLDYRAPGA